MSNPNDNSLFTDPDLAQFYDLAHRQRVDFDYCIELAADAKSVLDVGCGTGELIAALAEGREVVGVDPAGAMLDIARKRQNGAQARWVEADARNVRLEQRFDLIVLTGHAFQVFLTSQDQLAIFKTIAGHLKPSGRFILDSRNPSFSAPKSRENKTNSHIFTYPELGEIQMWNQSNYDEATRILTYQNGYDVLQTGQSFSQRAQILYTPKKELAAMIAEAGLVVDEWLGDWDGSSFHNGAREIIPIGRLA